MRRAPLSKPTRPKQPKQKKKRKKKHTNQKQKRKNTTAKERQPAPEPGCVTILKWSIPPRQISCPRQRPKSQVSQKVRFRCLWRQILQRFQQSGNRRRPAPQG